jgi:hypothetical protein
MIGFIIVVVVAWLVCTGSEGRYRGERGHDDRPSSRRPHALR